MPRAAEPIRSSPNSEQIWRRAPKFRQRTTARTRTKPADGEPLTAEGTYSGDTQDKTYITGKENSLDFAFYLAEGGLYAVTLTYSNNAEDGNHSYNVELAERYAQIYVNGEFVRTVFFRNTYAWDNFRTVTLYLEFESGSNVVSLSCNGEYAPATGQAAYLPFFAPHAVIAAATHE